MAVYELRRVQYLPISLQEAWDFIRSPQNLSKITPSYMRFTVINKELPEEMYPGMIINYKITPLLNIPMRWCTEITHVVPQQYFVDEQREGPYSLWHHQHHLEACEGGVKMTDIVNYKPPLGILGRMANKLFIHRQLEQIFAFRYEALEKRYGKMPV
jgi:ligand-binding SRPBCC domain-containing protein